MEGDTHQDSEKGLRGCCWSGKSSGCRWIENLSGFTGAPWWLVKAKHTEENPKGGFRRERELLYFIIISLPVYFLRGD